MKLNLFSKFFKKSESGANETSNTIFIPDDLGADNEQIQMIRELSKVNSEKRMSKVILLGNSGELKYYPLLKYSIKYDDDVNVKFAALKRIHLFKAHPDSVTMLTELANEININKLEPYYSMALSRMGIISLKEFEEKINRGK